MSREHFSFIYFLVQSNFYLKLLRRVWLGFSLPIHPSFDVLVGSLGWKLPYQILFNFSQLFPQRRSGPIGVSSFVLSSYLLISSQKTRYLWSGESCTTHYHPYQLGVSSEQIRDQTSKWRIVANFVELVSSELLIVSTIDWPLTELRFCDCSPHQYFTAVPGFASYYSGDPAIVFPGVWDGKSADFPRVNKVSPSWSAGSPGGPG